MEGFSREIIEPRGMNGFSRMNNIIDGYTLSGHDTTFEDELDGYTLSGCDMQGRGMRRIKRFYRRNAPWSYIGTAFVGLVVVDLATGGKIRKLVGMKKKKK
tara:strand:- start:305 stop:607 length:303 start_codon:yes stop_codon:yes gene_type:complete